MKAVCTVLIAIMLIVPLAGQARAGVSIGLLGGVTRMSWNGDTPEKGAYRPIWGPAAGAEIGVDIYRATTLCLQPSFVRRGTKIAFEVTGEKERVDSVEVVLDYFSLPLLVKVETLRGRFYVSGGFELSWLLKARYRTDADDLDVKFELGEHDLSVNFGIGYEFPAGPTSIWFEIRYAQSLINVGSEEAGTPGANPVTEPRLKNNGVMLLVGILYDL